MTRTKRGPDKKDGGAFKMMYMLLMVVAILISFALGHSAKDMRLPEWLKGSGQNESRAPVTSVDVEDLYNKLKKNYDGEIDQTRIEDSVRRGLVGITNDPYTSYFTSAEYEEFRNSLNGKFSGIGAELGKKDEQLIVVTPLDGSPAKNAGLKSGDVIVKINGEGTTGMSVDMAVKKIRGEAGTEVALGIGRPEGVVDIKITRGDIKLDSVKSELLAGNIGYIKVSRFGDDTYTLAAKAARDFKDKGVKKIILDLRGNGGGLVESAVAVAGIWMGNKPVLSERVKGIEKNVYKTTPNPIFNQQEVKTVILINEGSASASEIVAAALRDGGAAFSLVGKKTFGKGSVQNFVDLEDGSKLKVTIAHWFTPNGKTIDEVGIDPDVDVANSGTEGRDEQKEKAIELLNAQ
jgi:carboxyl-terminal processing protease